MDELFREKEIILVKYSDGSFEAYSNNDVIGVRSEYSGESENWSDDKKFAVALEDFLNKPANVAPIYTMNEAVDILEKFDDLLIENGIRIPSPEDDQREPENDAALYGSVYWDLLDYIEENLITISERVKAGGECIYGVLNEEKFEEEKEND